MVDGEELSLGLVTAGADRPTVGCEHFITQTISFRFTVSCVSNFHSRIRVPALFLPISMYLGRIGVLTPPFSCGRDSVLLFEASIVCPHVGISTLSFVVQIHEDSSESGKTIIPNL